MLCNSFFLSKVTTTFAKKGRILAVLLLRMRSLLVIADNLYATSVARVHLMVITLVFQKRLGISKFGIAFCADVVQ